MFSDTFISTMDSVAQFFAFPLVWPIFPWLMWFISTKMLKRKMERYSVAAGFFLSASITIYIYATLFGWILRDGLGPGAVTSRGTVMLERLLTAALTGAALAIPTSALFAYAYFQGQRKID